MRRILFISLIVFLLFAGTATAADLYNIYITSPTSGSSYRVGSSVPINAESYDSFGILNPRVIFSITDPLGRISYQTVESNPSLKALYTLYLSQQGAYTVTVRGYSGDYPATVESSPITIISYGAPSGVTIGASPSPAQPNERINFTGQVTSGGNLNWSWDFGDDTPTATGKSVSHKYANTGTYTVTATATNSVGSATGTRTITIAELPTISISSPESSRPNTSITFTGSRQEGAKVTGWSWDFGDDTPTATGKSVSHKYANKGTYTVTLSATSVAGTATTTKSILIVDPPSGVSVTSPATNAVIKTGDSVSFNAQSTGGAAVISWEWVFGDGSTGTTYASSTTHTYSTAGHYEPYVVANSSADGSTTSSAISLYITTPPTVTAITLPENDPNVNTQVTETITYTAPSNVPTGYTAYVVVSDGQSQATTDYAVSFNPSPITHTITYTTSGNKTVSAHGELRKSGATTLSTTPVTETITILPPSPSGITVTIVPADGIVEVNSQVTFTATAGTDSGPINTYTWDFGDGATTPTSLSQISHSYIATGTYHVSLTATGDGGSTEYTDVATITVGETAVTLNKNTYYIGTDTQIIATYSITPYDSTASYALNMYKLTNTYAIDKLVSSQTITSGSGTKTYDISSIDRNGIYGFYLMKNGEYVANPVVVPVRYSGGEIDVTIYAGTSLLSTEATVTLQSGGTDIETKTTSNGTTFFAPVTAGSQYTVVVTVDGYASQSKSITAADGTNVVTIDMGTTIPSGYGAQYQPIVAAWVVTNKFGAPLEGVEVTCVGIDQAFDNETLNKIYNFILSAVLTRDEQRMITDSRGQVTFNVLPTALYKLTFTHDGESITSTYNIGTSQPTITVVFDTSTKSTDLNKIIETSYTFDEGTFTVYYNDLATPSVTTNVSITLLNDSGETITTWSAPTSTATQTFVVTDYYNQDYKITITGTTSLGTYTKTFNCHANGPRIDFGLPPTLLIWIALFMTLAVGAAFSRLTVSMGAFAVCLFAWLMYGLGWLYQLEDAVGTIPLMAILMFATLMSIAFMFADRER